VALGATAAGWLAGALGLAVLASPLADVRSLFPSVAAHVSWRAAAGALVDAVHGARVEPGGELVLLLPRGASALTSEPGVLEALLAVAPLALFAPPWASAPISGSGRAGGALATAGLVVVLLHAVAARRLTPGWLLGGGALLALQAIAAHVWPRRRRGTLAWL
jgi:hypothetical protein